MKKCELCEKVARMYCDSDQASLCFDCDYRVHTANFIVSKHTRTLLCHACQNLTPWTGSGSKLGPTVSVCNACSVGRRNPDPQRNENSEDDEEDDNDEEEEDGDGENQVVPLSPPPSSTSEGCSSSSSGFFRSDLGSTSSESSRKRRRWLRGSDHGNGDRETTRLMGHVA